MPIPSLTAIGLLPAGTHDCTIDEIKNTFGVFRSSDRRILMTQKLEEYLGLLKTADVGELLYVDGSYVTGKEEPGDIDLLLILKSDALIKEVDLLADSRTD